ncbi:MAG: DoxX family protein [Planctomycetia bacterium]|nr:DoxX family protein [Planctomycetia bacterium]
MNSKRETLTSVGLLLLRVGIGCLMLVHGIAKIQGFGEMSQAFPDPIGWGSQLSLIMAIGAEVGCSLLLIVGLASRLAAIPLAFTMIVALFVVHRADPWQVKELAATYLLAYVSLLLTGPGRFSLDHWWRTNPSKGESGGVENS